MSSHKKPQLFSSYLKRPEKPKGDTVALKVRAVDQGYIKGKIIQPGEEFLFEGQVYGRKLAYWMEEVEPGSLEKQLPKLSSGPRASSAPASATAPAAPSEPAASAPASEPQTAADLV